VDSEVITAVLVEIAVQSVTILKMRATGSSEKLVILHQSTGRHIQKD
jgi:hypothetical protein